MLRTVAGFRSKMSVATGIGLIVTSAFFSIATAAGEKHPIKIVYSLDNNDETQNVILDSMIARVKSLNDTRPDINVQMVMYDARASVDKQLSDIQTAILTKPDVLIYSPVDNVGSLPAAQAAKDAGVKIIDKRPTDPEPSVFDVAFYANDEARWSKATTDWIQSVLDADPKTMLKIGVIYGQPAQTAQLLRIDAIKAMAAKNPDRMQIVAEAYGNWLTETAQNIAQDWIQSHPEINYIAAANDIMATGVSNAVVGANKKAEILISGYDTTDDGLRRINAGTQDFDVGVPYAGYAEAINVAVDLALGKPVARVYKVSAIDIVSRKNISDYMKQRRLD